MIRWLWSRMMKWGWDFNRYEDACVPVSPGRRSLRDSICESDSGIDLHDPITFRVQSVQGGTLIETRWTDPKTDNWERRLHIVAPEENLSEAIGKIVTMELIRR